MRSGVAGIRAGDGRQRRARRARILRARHARTQARSVTPAGYSGTPLPRKLGIKDGHRVLLSGAPPKFDKTLGTLPASVRVHRRSGRDPYDVILLFARTRGALARGVRAMKDRLDPAGGLWLCWPKKASGVATDLADGVVRQAGLDAGLVDNKVCAVDETWSGLRFVYRLEDRA